MIGDRAVVLDGGDFADTQFVGIDLGAALLREKEFLRCRFLRVRLQQASLVGCEFDHCEFDDSDLSLVGLHNSRWCDVRFSGCKLVGVAWPNARTCQGLEFLGSTLDNSSFVGLPMKRARFNECRLRDVSFAETDLREAAFSGCDLTGSSFIKTNLAKADLATSKGYVINPVTNVVKGARFSLEGAVMLAGVFGVRIAGVERERR